MSEKTNENKFEYTAPNFTTEEIVISTPVLAGICAACIELFSDSFSGAGLSKGCIEIGDGEVVTFPIIILSDSEEDHPPDGGGLGSGRIVAIPVTPELSEYIHPADIELEEIDPEIQEYLDNMERVVRKLVNKVRNVPDVNPLDILAQLAASNQRLH